jgi:hypothetical protein
MAELLRVTYEQLLGCDEKAALQMGIAAAIPAFSGVHGAFIIRGDPSGTVLSLRHLWRSSYDFGTLDASNDSASSVTFTLKGFPDVSACHAMMIASWAVAAAQISGADQRRLEVLERPWTGQPTFRYRVVF